MVQKTGRKTVLVTGASIGLGLAIAKTLIRTNRYHLILTARESSLSRFKENGIEENENLWIRSMDVTDLNQRREVVSEIDVELNGVDYLVNNAGFSLRAVVEHVSESDRLKQMDINFRAPIGLVRLVLPKMRQKHSGHIINVSSVGGMMAMPTMAVYSASKFALEGASEALWYEVRPWNIHVSLVQPGFIHSNSFRNVKMTKESQRSMADPREGYFHHYQAMSPFIERMMTRSIATPEKVAKVVLKTMESKRPPLRVSGTPDAYFFSMLRRFLPRSIYHRLLYILLPNISRWGKVGN